MASSHSARQHGEVLRQESVLSAGRTRALLSQPRPDALSVEAVSALQHTQILLAHVLMTDDTWVLHVQCLGLGASMGTHTLPGVAGGWGTR